MSSDIVADWDVPLPDGKHKVEFEHGTTSGKRAIYVDGKQIYKEDWMFKLVGKEHFKIGKHCCTITIDACSGFAYEYTLDVNGKPLRKFRENQCKIMNCWLVTVGSKDSTRYRIVLEKDTMNVWVNGEVVETSGQFSEDEDATETHFCVGLHHPAYIKTTSTGNKRTGIQHQLFVDEQEIPCYKE